MANLVALRSAIRASRATWTASRAIRRSTAAGLSAADRARAARSSWAFFASAAALRRSAKLVFFDLSISVFTLKKTAPGIEDRRFQIGARHAIFQGTGETKIEKLARLSGQAEVVGARKRRGCDIRGKMSAPISRVPRRAPPKPKVARLNGSRNEGYGKVSTPETIASAGRSKNASRDGWEKTGRGCAVLVRDALPQTQLSSSINEPASPSRPGITLSTARSVGDGRSGATRSSASMASTGPSPQRAPWQTGRQPGFTSGAGVACSV